MESTASPSPARVDFQELIDLACESVGGKALFANDEFFAPKENLLKRAAPIFIPGKYVETGKWMDGWESRRKRVPDAELATAHDQCLIRLGIPGEIRGVVVDTAFFTGNYPEYASIEATDASADASVADLEKSAWREVLAKSALQGSTQNCFSIPDRGRATHLRLRIFPDGGVARLRVHGVGVPDPARLAGLFDLAAAENGAAVVAASDVHYGSKDSLILPGRTSVMGEGWETRRRRGPGFDWIVVRLAATGRIEKLEIDTHHYRGNFPDRAALEGLAWDGPELKACDLRDRASEFKWVPLLPQTKLRAHDLRALEGELLPAARSGAYRYVRLSIFPDGGVGRLRVWGRRA